LPRTFGIITLYTPEIKSWAAHTTAKISNYAKEQEYGYICERHLDYKRHPSWSKVLAMSKHLEHFDWLCWMDADMVIQNEDFKLDSLIDQNFDIIAIREEMWAKAINMGLFFMKNSPWCHDFIKQWYEHDIGGEFWEQSSFNDLYEGIKNHVKIIPQRPLAPFPEIYQEGDFLIHYAAYHKQELCRLLT
jgi:hypothetical protein